jgi:ribosome-associated toxin RatA of RatAB toxin-antitoxin module
MEKRMPIIEGSIDISASRQAVWDLMSDVPRYPEFGNMTDVATMITEGEFGEGSVYSETGKVAGMKSTTEWTVTRFAPPSEQTHIGKDSSIHIDLMWTLAEIESGTRASHVVEFKMMPGFRPLGVLLEALFVTRMMTKEMETVRGDLKHIAETEASTGG